MFRFVRFFVNDSGRKMSYDAATVNTSKKELKLAKKQKEKEAKKERKQERKRKNQKISALDRSISDYYFSEGFRRVYPYHFTYETYAKRRWLGRTISDVLNTEFHCHSYKSFENSIKDGKVKIGGNNVRDDYVLKDNDRITHVVHRHELPVLDIPVDTVYEDEKVFIVDKPPSLPIHPCGRYNLNSLIYILRKEYGRENIRVVHRLDRMTSGLVIFCKDYDTATRFSTEISERKVKKTYLSLVEGKFPEEVECNAPLGTLSAKFGIHRVIPLDEGGKPAETIFRLRSYDSAHNISIVECHPRTGRTHQIRIHLQYLGYPILNDPIYNSSVWGPLKGREGKYGIPLEQIIDAFKTENNVETLIHQQDTSPVVVDVTDKADDPPRKRSREDENENKTLRNTFDSSKLIHDSSCVECTLTFKDPKPDSLFIYLHAYQYEGPNWKYTSALPKWAT